MNIFLLAGSQGQKSTVSILVIYVLMIAVMYFLLIRPKQKEEKKKKELLEGIAVGDGVLTTAGFYGVIIDIAQDTVIVEFGNKNCRIPMQKAAIVSVEKPNYTKTLQYFP